MKKEVEDIVIIREKTEKDFLNILKKHIEEGYVPYLGQIDITEKYNSDRYITTIIKYKEKKGEDF